MTGERFRHAGTARRAAAMARAISARAAVGVLVAMIAGIPAASAKVPTLLVSSDADLRFGRFLAFGNASRAVSASGSIIDQGVYPVAAGDTGPAAFTVSYDRGNESNRPLNLEIEIVLSQPGTQVIGGVSGHLSAFVTDLPGATSYQPGQVIRIVIANCTARVCSRSFRVGARLDVARSHGGARLVFPLPIDAALVAAR